VQAIHSRFGLRMPWTLGTRAEQSLSVVSKHGLATVTAGTSTAWQQLDGSLVGSWSSACAVRAHIPSDWPRMSTRWPSTCASVIDGGPSTPQYRTLRGNLTEQQQAIPWRSLPKTFRDAATVTLQLGIRYLWIDCLCIVQDDPQDWKDQAAKMYDIYQGAYLTLAASCAADSGDGLFRIGLYRQVKQNALCSPLYVIRRIPEHPTWNEDEFVQMSYHLPALNRAWVYQERLLSRSVVHYTR
jgi:hypothetical protein